MCCSALQCVAVMCEMNVLVCWIALEHVYQGEGDWLRIYFSDSKGESAGNRGVGVTSSPFLPRMR